MLNKQAAAQLLAEAVILGDAKACARAGKTLRTLQNYRKRLETDTELSRFFTLKKELLEREWASSLAPAIRSALAFIERAGNEGNAKNPEMVYSMAGALKVIADLALTKEVLDARFAANSRAENNQPREVAASHLSN